VIAIKAAGDAFVHQVGVRSFDGCAFGGKPARPVVVQRLR